VKNQATNNNNIQQNWYVIDATDKILGRLASGVAKLLRGKHKPEYAPNIDVGDYIIVTNAEKVRVTGNKQEKKIYYHHSGFPGGIKSINFEKLIAKKPELVIEKAVRGMLPKGPLGRQMFRKLKVYAGAEHKHTAQCPESLDIELE
jgi:large subunit ribosomal protein L13